MTVAKGGQGRRALTHYKTIETYGRDASLIECRLSTGRTHQIRVHMASLGCPVAGDDIYGRHRHKVNQGMLLHAESLCIRLPIDDKLQRFRAPLPDRFRATPGVIDSFQLQMPVNGY